MSWPARKRFKSTTMSEPDQPIAANVLARQFDAAGHNQRWVGDTTEFRDRRQREALPGRDSRPVFYSGSSRTRLEQHGVVCSMSRRGNCYDVIESWFSR